MGAALETRVAAAFVSGPPLAAIRSETRVIGSPYAAIASQWPVNLWFATRPWLAANAATARRFAQAVKTAAPWINAHPAETLAVMRQYAPNTADVPNLVRAQFTRPARTVVHSAVLDAALRAGTIKTAMNARDLIANV